MGTVRTGYSEHIAYLTLDRPEARNALSTQMCSDVVAALDEIDNHLRARVVIVEGEGRIFCSGADFAAVSGPAGLEFLPAFESMLARLDRFRLPTIARIQGAAMGGGLQLATACDFRLAAEDATLGIPSSRLGIVVNYENVQRLVLVAGLAVAKEVLMTARSYSAAEAAEAGLVTRVCPAADLLAITRQMAEDIAMLAPLGVQGAKRSLIAVGDRLAAPRDLRVTASFDEIDGLVAAAYRSADLQEGISAMGQKRAPRFEGR
ncbi:MAG: enoyl-CoA hydratase/isomerase family protein [Actinomycetota bacterium]